MFRPGWWLAAIWAAAVLLIWLWWPDSGAEVDRWTAVRALPRNHQIREGDLHGPTERYRQARMAQKAALLGQHLKASKKAREPIRSEDVMAQPTLEPCEPGSGVLFYSLKGEELLADGVEIGSWVIPCSIRPSPSASAPVTTKCARTPVAVEVVHRPSGASDSTWLALRIPSCRLSEIGEYLAREKRFLLVAANPPPPRNQACPAR